MERKFSVWKLEDLSFIPSNWDKLLNISGSYKMMGLAKLLEYLLSLIACDSNLDM